MLNLVEPDWLANHINDPDLVIVDVRWYLGFPDKGRQEFELSRIPGSCHLDIENDLSAKNKGSSGRHPLPDPEKFIKTLSENGIGKNSRIVVYDDAGGAIAARFWWMLKWINGPDTKILNGGFQGWVALNLPVESGKKIKSNNLNINIIKPELQNEMVVNKADLLKLSKNTIILDARDRDRYLGKYEPVDPVAGHIPGALNSPFKDNLTTGNVPQFQKPEVLRKHFESLGINEDSHIISYCGSGVTACHNILALEIAGFTNVSLYPGSWSEWCHDKTMKIEID